jgi:hypothetical protein
MERNREHNIQTLGRRSGQPLPNNRRAQHLNHKRDNNPFNGSSSDEFANAYEEGYERGYREAYDLSYDEGYIDGYNDGYGDHEYNRRNLDEGHPEDQRWHKRKSWSWYWL